MAIIEYKGLKIDTDTLKKEDMPTEVFGEIFELCGAEVAVSILINMTGNIIQVPTKGLINIEKKIILSEYNGTTSSIRQIQRKYGVSDSYVREIIKSAKIEPPAEGQLDFGFHNKKEEVSA